MSNEIKMEDEKDEFPIGLRVLSVDDDLVCLRILEANLIQCKYKVTSTTSAIEALNMLRQNKNNYDIIITDVHMPDMDGFELLKHVGLEMDLPCIVLSANDDPNTVLKGIEHGACGYLLKPVRVEELKNIWQHVIRKKNGCKKHINSNNTTSDDVKGGNINRKPHTKKRNQKNDDEKEKDEETISAIESVSTKKSRIAWTQELHQKFVDAIEVMGVNKAVPKKILEMMNVEGLSRASVASHLQKYRLYLKKLEDKANVIALMGLRDQHLNTAAFDSHKDFQSCSSSSNHIQTLQPYQQNTLGKGNSRMALGNNNVAHGLAQVRLPPHINNPINSHENRFHQGNIHRQMPPTSQKRLLIPEKNSFNGFQKPSYTYWLSHVNGNISMPMSSTMIHSTVASDSLPMNVDACMNNVNFASTNGSVPRSTIGVYNNRPTVDPMPMVNVANDGSNYLNFGNASQSRNRNIALGSQFDWQPLFDPYSSHSQRLNVGSNDIGTNSNEHQDYNNNMPLAQQQCKFIKSSPDNPFKNGDDISSLDNSFLQGDLGPSGCIFYGLENLIQQE